MDGHLWAEAKPWRHVSHSLPETALVPRNCEFIVNEVLFWLGCYYLSNAISIALAYVIIGACNTMKRKRNGNQ